jgi:hypothetical protein
VLFLKIIYGLGSDMYETKMGVKSDCTVNQLWYKMLLSNGKEREAMERQNQDNKNSFVQ